MGLPYRFNPALGFLPVSTLLRLRRCRGSFPFQSRSGFSPRLDPTPSVSPITTSGFNPALGFLPVSTSFGQVHSSRQSAVSIPLWVFSPSRLPTSRVFPSFVAPFQSRSGFSPRLDDCTGWYRHARRSVSIPLWVFSPSRRAASSHAGTHASLFQSRSGFSPRLDVPRNVNSSSFRDVSIPLWVFSPSRRTDSRPHEKRPCFNPALGFLPVSTGRPAARAREIVWFQSRSGFSPRLDVSLTEQSVTS